MDAVPKPTSWFVFGVCKDGGMGVWYGSGEGGQMVSPSRNPKIGLLRLGPAGLTFSSGYIHHVPAANKTYELATAFAKTSAAHLQDTLIRRGIVAAATRNPDNKKHGGHTVKESKRSGISDSFFVNAFGRNDERQTVYTFYYIIDNFPWIMSAPQDRSSPWILAYCCLFKELLLPRGQ